MSAGIKRTPIYALSHGSRDFFLVAIIIAKQNPRTITIKSDGSRRSVWNFTLRDSPADYINVSFWGSPEFMENMARTFHVGDIVDIVQAKTVYPKNEDSNFMPNVTSPLLLQMNEGISEMSIHSEQDYAELHRLLRLPTRPPGDYLTLSDVHTHVQALCGKHVNLLVAISSVGPLRQITSKKDSKLIECRTLEVMDYSPSHLSIQIWDAEVAYRADNWKPRETILFIADVRLDWDTYHKKIRATVTARTIITENPEFPDAIHLRKYARTAPTNPTAILDNLATNFPEPATINTVMSCNAVWEKAVSGGSADSFTALVFAAVLHLDLDGQNPVTVSKCLQCQMVVDESVGICMNTDCPVSTGLERPVTERVYDLRVTLSDHTGSLPNCRVTSVAATNMLQCSPQEFECLSLEAKTQLKWQFLMKRCASRLVILPRERLPLISIVAIDRVSLSDYARKLPMY